MKCGTGTGLTDMHDEEISMCDRLLLHDSDGRTHKILVGFNFGMFVEDGTGDSLFSVIDPYACYNGGFGVEIRKKKVK